MKPWHSTRPRSGRPLMGTGPSCGAGRASTNLRDLRAALRLFEFRRALRCALRCRSCRVLGQAQLQQVPWRHGVVAPDNDDLAEQFLEAGRGFPVQGSLASEHTAEEPARTVDADEARHAVSLGPVVDAGG